MLLVFFFPLLQIDLVLFLFFFLHFFFFFILLHFLHFVNLWLFLFFMCFLMFDVSSKKLIHSKCLYFGYFITFLLISFNSILFPYTREEKWVVNFLWRCQGGWNIWFFVLGVDFWISLHSRWQLLWKLRCLCMTFKFTSFLDCFNLFLSYWNLYQIQNVCKQYGI